MPLCTCYFFFVLTIKELPQNYCRNMTSQPLCRRDDIFFLVKDVRRMRCSEELLGSRKTTDTVTSPWTTARWIQSHVWTRLTPSLFSHIRIFRFLSWEPKSIDQHGAQSFLGCLDLLTSSHRK